GGGTDAGRWRGVQAVAADLAEAARIDGPGEGGLRRQRGAELIQGAGAELLDGAIGHGGRGRADLEAGPRLIDREGGATAERMAAVGDGGGERIVAGVDEGGGRVFGAIGAVGGERDAGRAAARPGIRQAAITAVLLAQDAQANGAASDRVCGGLGR